MIVDMAKYDPLYHYLRRKTAADLPMTFRDIERVISSMLPKSANLAQWWANEESEESRHVQAKAWLSAGFRAFLTGPEQVSFRRIEKH